MLKHYFTITFRNLRKHRSFSIINIAGLALGITCFTLIALYVQYELSFDRFYTESDRIYRVVQQHPYDKDFASTGGAHAVALRQEFPEFEEVVRVHQAPVEVQRLNQSDAVRQEEKHFYFADSSFFRVFDFPLLAGNPQNVLNAPDGVVLTKSTAQRYFGDEEPLGRTIRVGDDLELEVRGIVADPPSNSHLQFDFLSSVAALKRLYHYQGNFTSYWWPWLWTYVKLSPNASAEAVNARMPGFSERYRKQSGGAEFVPELQALADIHLYSNTQGDPRPGGSITYVTILSAISLLILFIACINFTNLSLARSVQRAKEVGVRKTAGANRGVLVRQFLGESLMLSITALMIGLLLTELLLPFFGELAQRPLTIDFTEQFPFWIVLLAVVLITGLLAGSYPAWVLSGVNAARVLKGQLWQPRGQSNLLQRSLLVFQFVASIALIAGTLIAYQQLNYLQEAGLGFAQEQILTVALPNEIGDEKIASLERAFGSVAEVQQTSRTFERPGFGNGIDQAYEVEEMTKKQDRGNRIFRQHVGYDYFDLLDIPLVSGRTFFAASGTDDTAAVVLNQRAVRQFGFTPETALGKSVRTYVQENGQTYGDLTGTVVGVVADYHGTSLRDPIEPTVFMSSEGALSQYTHHLLIKASGKDVASVRRTLEQQWKTVLPDRYFEASFLDTDLALRYAEEQRLGKIMLTFSILAILIACLGLYGLASYLAERRTKEIGIRKTLGASVQQLLVLFNQDFVRLILIAFVVAIPITYYAMNRWLQDFAYHIDIGVAVFIVAGLLCLVVALATVSYQSLRAAWTNPVDALRNE